MSAILASLLLLSSASVNTSERGALSFGPLDCPIENAIYGLEDDPHWSVSFHKAPIPPTASSDLLMVVSSIDFVRDFALTSAQGFGGTSLLVTKHDLEEGQMRVAEEQPDGPMEFHAFHIDKLGTLVRMGDTPKSGTQAPPALYIPDVSRYFWYDEKYVDTETGKTLPEPVVLKQGIFIGSCKKEN